MPDGLVRVVGVKLKYGLRLSASAVCAAAQSTAGATRSGRERTGSTMLPFLGKRLLQLIPTLFFVSVIIFSLQQLLPGDPALVMAGEERDPEVLEQIRKQYRLDQPLPMQYLYWVRGVLSGDLGESMRIKEPVSDADRAEAAGDAAARARWRSSSRSRSASPPA